MLGYLCIAGTEIANPNRTMAYLRNVGNRCAIGPNLNTGCDVVDDTVYTTPAQDDAPWWDENDPRSDQFLGVWLSTSVLGTPYAMETTGLNWGGSHGAKAWGTREMLIEGILLGSSRAGVEYGRQWLMEALQGAPCDDCDAPSATILRHCPIGSDNGERFVHQVALNSIAFSDQDADLPLHCALEFSATLTASVPWVTKAPVRVFDSPLLPPSIEPLCDVCGQIARAFPQTNVVPGLACGCVTTAPRRISRRRRPGCYVPPMSVVRQVAVIDNAKQWADATLRVTVSGGSENFSTAGLRNLRVRGYANPLGFSAGDLDTILASGDPCVDIQVGCVPTGAYLVIDGAARRSIVGVGESVRDGLSYLSAASGRFMWPDYGCSGLVLVIEADSVLTSSDATISIDTIEVERA